jgi:hypothetical protein
MKLGLDTAYLEAFEAAKDMWIEAIRTRGDNPNQQQFKSGCLSQVNAAAVYRHTS